MEWLEPWDPIDSPQRASAFEARLGLELAPEHPLFGIPMVALAHGYGDDILFALLDGTRRVAVVHLTWTSKPPETPPWPGFSLYSHFRVWVNDRMREDHNDWFA